MAQAVNCSLQKGAIVNISKLIVLVMAVFMLLSVFDRIFLGNRFGCCICN